VATLSTEAGMVGLKVCEWRPNDSSIAYFTIVFHPTAARIMAAAQAAELARSFELDV